MAVPDNSSIWELQTPSSQPSGWDGGSVWDLPVDPPTQGASVDQIQQMERGKAAKLEQERREAELRAKREEEERKLQEEICRHQEELLRRREEERKRREEEDLARRKQEEALRRQREQEAALRRQREEEERQQQEEALRRHEERRREEEERRQREEMLRKQEEERRHKEEEAARWVLEEEEARRRIDEENRLRLEETRLRLEEEERKRKEIERQKEQLQRQEVIRQRQQEALRRLQQHQQQQQLAQMKLPSSSTWGQQAAPVSPQIQGTLSLAEIQKLEEERERQLREEQRRQQQELMKVLQQQHHQQQKLPGWGNIPKTPVATKSLLEIQQEEARQMQKQQQNKTQTKTSVAAKLNLSGSHEETNFKNNTVMKREESTTKRVGAERNQHSSLPVSNATSVWGSVNTSPTNQWATDMSSVWGAPDNKNSNMGFWDEAVKEVGPPTRNQTSKSSKSNSNAGKSYGVQAKQNKKIEEEEKLMKLFQGVNKAQDGFTLWCEQMLHVLNTANNLDVPTFVSFLKEVDSPYEVHDYVRAYLGETPETKEFAKQFLERRANQKTNQQQQHPQQRQQQDSAWAMGQTSLQSIFPSNHSRTQQSNFETVQSGKKKKKQKMIPADPSILGFSVNASSERLNMGEIETLDDY
uniref:GRB10 interacting GYF protein 2 n=1 Tax=Callorhinchus milii TaxID=7868 RepID=A0A4W3J8Z6_CALMI